MTTQPEALRLAELLITPYQDARRLAAAELRRLHEEVTWMKHNMSNVVQVEQSLIAANERLHAENEWLKKSLKDLMDYMEDAEVSKPRAEATRQWQGLTDDAIYAAAEVAWRAGWTACRDAEFVGEEAEDEAWGYQGATVAHDAEAKLREKNGGGV